MTLHSRFSGRFPLILYILFSHNHWEFPCIICAPWIGNVDDQV